MALVSHVQHGYTGVQLGLLHLGGDCGVLLGLMVAGGLAASPHDLVGHQTVQLGPLQLWGGVGLLLGQVLAGRQTAGLHVQALGPAGGHHGGHQVGLAVHLGLLQAGSGGGGGGPHAQAYYSPFHVKVLPLPTPPSREMTTSSL